MCQNSRPVTGGEPKILQQEQSQANNAQADQSFDGLAQKFAQNIYGTGKGRIRAAVVWQDLLTCLAQLPKRPLRILDAGGGFGFFSQQLAALGHQVVLCDLSADMLEEASRQLAEQGLSDRVRLIHCAIQDLPAQLEGEFDLILCHAVLEWLSAPRDTLLSLLGFLAPDGILSLMFYNRQALLFQSLVVGNFDYIRAGLVKRRKQKLTPSNPQEPEAVYGWLTDAGMALLGKTGVRVIHDYMRHKSDQVSKFDDLLAMEQRYCRQEPFISLGRYVHVMARRPTAAVWPPSAATPHNTDNQSSTKRA
ncbi:MAG: tRNA uridine 5-oxyacetic acid(34) methyltransferase CmoM [Aeromonadaceae bacterium]|nr:tRNA uridine 5-oxyacetic acid(34) methyltransferase CmoM [Aeromonadaceae bacterium]